MSDGRNDPKPGSLGRGSAAMAKLRAVPSQAFGDEQALVAQVGARQANAFRTLLDRHLSVVVSVAYHVLGDASEAEDVAQETFARLWRGAEGLEVGGAGIRPWLRRVARNLSIDRLRATRRLDVVDEVPDPGAPAEQQRALELQDQHHRVAEVVAALPDRQRVAVTLFHFEGVSQADIAQTLETSVDAVESLLARARRRLKVALQDEWRSLLDENAAE